MTVMGFDTADWWTDPRLVVAVKGAVPTVSDARFEFDGERLTARCTSKHEDRYSTAFMVTEALTPLWSDVVSERVGLVVILDQLRIDVPPEYFADGVFTRRRWATHARTMLVNV